MKRCSKLYFILVLFLSSCTPGSKSTVSPTEGTITETPVNPTLPPETGWVLSNPGGGGAFAAVGAGPTEIILAGSDLSGAYISRDRGESWNPLGYANGLGSTHVSAVGFDTQDENILYLGTDSGIHRSRDAGFFVSAQGGAPAQGKKSNSQILKEAGTNRGAGNMIRPGLVSAASTPTRSLPAESMSHFTARARDSAAVMTMVKRGRSY